MTLGILTLLMLSGALAGVLAGLLGIGGGLVIVPILYFTLQSLNIPLDDIINIATATSLACIVPTSLSSVRAHIKRGNVDWTVLRFWAPFVIASAVFCGAGSRLIDGQLLTVLFACVLFYSAYRMLTQRSSHMRKPTLQSRALQALGATITGGLSVAVGIGGGTLGVPMLVASGLSMHKAVGTAAVFGLLIALPGAIAIAASASLVEISYAGVWRLFYWPAILVLVPFSVLFAPVGAGLASRLDALKLQRVFAMLLVFVAVRMFLVAIS